MKVEQVPLLTAAGLAAHHFLAVSEWQPENLPIHDIFHVNRLEQYIDHMLFPLPPHRKTVHDFIFLTGGSTGRSKGLDGFLVEENTFFFLPAYHITTHEFMSADVTGFYCHFDLDLVFRNFVPLHVLQALPFLQFTGNPLVHVSAATRTTALAILDRLEAEYHSDAPDKLDIIRAYLLALFAELKRHANPAEKPVLNSAGRILELYKNALTQHIYEMQTVAAYAGHLAVSPNHLNKCVKAITGKSAQSILDDMLVLETKTLLKQTDLTINEISYKLGKSDQSSFSRFFRSQTGSTPKEYKRS
ncbi:MAG TPA: helix-turn-helix transcriptional regulator [Hymenobacter sp.]|jgi:AraC-like DNA-binding protein|uniref:helix-turn-helix domain-containing protein n=1 Tax=Hymenobacter sp. TaxID=1898978 RepID=UPI002EDAD2A8